MNRNAIFGGMIVIAMISADATAQNTLGELLDAGAKKLSKDEIQAAFSGARSTGKTAGGATIDLEFKTDGTYSVIVQSPQGNSGGMGKWTATAGDKLCVEWTPVGRGAMTKGGGCVFYYLLSGNYYYAESGDRSALVTKRTLTK